MDLETNLASICYLSETADHIHTRGEEGEYNTSAVNIYLAKKDFPVPLNFTMWLNKVISIHIVAVLRGFLEELPLHVILDRTHYAETNSFMC